MTNINMYNAVCYDGVDSYVIKTLGYRAIEDESKAENVGDWWIYHYIKIEDTTGRK